MAIGGSSILLVALALVATSARAQSCGTASACEGCVTNSSCMWVTLANASGYCDLSTNSLPRTSRSSLTSNATACALENFTIVSGVSDPSLEEYGSGSTAWVPSSTKSSDSIICGTSCLGSDTTSTTHVASWNKIRFDKAKIAWFGVNVSDSTPIIETLTQSIVIPKSATHLSFFARGSVASLSKSRLEVIVDDVVLMTIDYTNISPIAPTSSLPYHKPVYVDVSDYADGSTTRTLELRVANYQAGNTIIIIDYITLVNFPGKVGHSWINNAKYSDSSSCAAGCKTGWNTDSECDDACNNALCNFDSGACASSGSYSASSTSCYDWYTPKAKTIAQCFGTTATTTCCTTSSSVKWASNTYSTFNSSSQCAISDTCLSYLNNMSCSVCSSFTGVFISSGKIQVCQSYANSIWSACKDSYILSGGSCKTFSSTYSDITTFLETVWDAEYVTRDTGCYCSLTSECAAVASSGKSDNWKDIAIGVGVGVGGFVLIIAAVAIAACVIVLKHKPSSDKQEMTMSTLPVTSGQIIMMPDDGGSILMMPPAGVLGGVVLTDAAGNIITTSGDMVNVPPPQSMGLMSGTDIQMFQMPAQMQLPPMQMGLSVVPMTMENSQVSPVPDQMFVAPPQSEPGASE